ncbi:MAG: AbiH family protein [Saprospiraceae bacterium]
MESNIPEKESKTINRLILIGNGFDLAHEMKTKYSDFILDYFQQCWEEAKQSTTPGKPHELVYENLLLKFTFDRLILENGQNILINNLSEIRDLQNKGVRSGISPPILLKIKSNFLSSIVNDINVNNWVDIENNYYQELKKLIREHSQNQGSTTNSLRTRLIGLNNHFGHLKIKLENYLKTIKISEEYDPIFEYIYEKLVHLKNNSVENLGLGNVLLLNFNYTTTTDKYKRNDADIIHIHGKLSNENNPVIFGYGDERDETYDVLEKTNITEVFTHIKSFDYLKTNNYSRLLAFLESQYDVYIMGHSCGLSDRTLLSTIFEHENCRFIKIFYHNTPESYRNRTYEISRHFKDKAEMRKKVLDLTKCKPLPQIKSQAI